MSARSIDMVGRTCADLTVIGEAGRTPLGPMWLCRCVCGKTREVRGIQLRNGNVTCCGDKRCKARRGVGRPRVA